MKSSSGEILKGYSIIRVGALKCAHTDSFLLKLEKMLVLLAEIKEEQSTNSKCVAKIKLRSVC